MSNQDSFPEAVQTATSSFPQVVKLDDGAEVELKVAEHDNASAIIAFAERLDEQDLLFLRVDITEPAMVKNWLNNVTLGETVSILA